MLGLLVGPVHTERRVTVAPRPALYTCPAQEKDRAGISFSFLRRARLAPEALEDVPKWCRTPRYWGSARLPYRPSAACSRLDAWHANAWTSTKPPKSWVSAQMPLENGRVGGRWTQRKQRTAPCTSGLTVARHPA